MTETKVPRLAFTIGDRTVELKDVSLAAEDAEEGGDHGRLGQDLLREQGGYVLDFQTLRFKLIDSK